MGGVGSGDEALDAVGDVGVGVGLDAVPCGGGDFPRLQHRIGADEFVGRGIARDPHIQLRGQNGVGRLFLNKLVKLAEGDIGIDRGGRAAAAGGQIGGCVAGLVLFAVVDAGGNDGAVLTGKRHARVDGNGEGSRFERK